MARDITYKIQYTYTIYIYMDIKSRGAPLAASSVVRGQIGMPHICALRGGLAGTLQETVSGTLHMYIRQFMMLETQDTESKRVTGIGNSC